MPDSIPDEGESFLQTHLSANQPNKTTPVQNQAPRRRDFLATLALLGLLTSAPGAAAKERKPMDILIDQTENPEALGANRRGLERLTRVFSQMIEEGLHPGAQVSVFLQGRHLVSLAGGANPAGDKQVDHASLFQIRSVTKALTAMVIFRLKTKGLFSFGDPVAAHWPEFAARGKDKITIAQVMAHSAGLPDGPPIGPAAMNQPGIVDKALERMAPIWEPGTKNGYHAASYGWILDGLARRTDGRPIHEILRQEFLTPLAVPDLWMGLPAAEYPRLSPMLVEERFRQRQVQRARFADFLNTQEGIALPLSWVAGVANSRSLARMMDLIRSGGSAEGREFFATSVLDEAAVPQNPAGRRDERLSWPVCWGLGLILGNTPDIYGAATGPWTLGHAGGSAGVAWADREKGIAAAFLCNSMLSGGRDWARYRLIGDAIRAAAGQEE